LTFAVITFSTWIPSTSNYRDILKEVSYNPLMGDYLTFRQNKAHAFTGTYPDENYAREMMQLFTIGLTKLHPDGTQVFDNITGESIPTYDNDDIMSFARIWTGFDYQPPRSNVESYLFNSGRNPFDPMQIKPAWRDHFPKTKLDSGYIGDGYPLCFDLPYTFLSRGARYRLLGPGSAESSHFDEQLWMQQSSLSSRFSPSPKTSELYQQLCAPQHQGGNCTFPTEVVLPESLPCHGHECEIQRVRSVRIVNADNTADPMYYEFMPPACIRLAFFAGGRFTKMTRNERNSLTGEESPVHYFQCADPTTAVAGTACCLPGDESGVDSRNGEYCRYPGEWAPSAVSVGSVLDPYIV
jgi:hypothetical protein